MHLAEVLEKLGSLREAGDLQPTTLGQGDDPIAREVLLLVADPSLRPEHRARIYEDLDANRDLLLARNDPRLIDLVFWGEQVERLYAGFRRGKLSTFHYARALEATCRRCGFDLLPAVARMAELGREWSRHRYDRTLDLLSANVVEVESPGETTPELGA